MNPTEKTIRYGTYYTSREKDGTYSIVRILTAGDYGVHYAIYATKLNSKPTVQDIPDTPLVGHVPQDIRAVLSWDMSAMKHEDLTTKDLEGFSLYAEARGIDESEIQHEITSIIEFSKSGKSLTIHDK